MYTYLKKIDYEHYCSIQRRRRKKKRSSIQKHYCTDKHYYIAIIDVINLQTHLDWDANALTPWVWTCQNPELDSETPQMSSVAWYVYVTSKRC